MVEIIKKYKNYIDFWKSKPDMGIYDTQNKGIKISKEEWLVFLNAGDTFAKSNSLEKLIHYVQVIDKSVDLCVFPIYLANGEMFPKKLKNDRYFIVDILNQQCLVYNCRIFSKTMYDPYFVIPGDTELLIRVLLVERRNFAIYPEPIVGYGQMRRYLDITKAEKEFDFKARTKFEEGLKRKTESYKLMESNLNDRF